MQHDVCGALETLRFGMPAGKCKDEVNNASDFGGDDIREGAYGYFSYIADRIEGLTPSAHFVAGGNRCSNPTMLPGQSLYRELELLRGASLDGYEVIASATLIVARFFGEEGTRGSVSEGKTADFVLLNVNLVEAASLDRGAVEAVIKDGVLFN